MAITWLLALTLMQSAAEAPPVAGNPAAVEEIFRDLQGRVAEDSEAAASIGQHSQQPFDLDSLIELIVAAFPDVEGAVANSLRYGALLDDWPIPDDVGSRTAIVRHLNLYVGRELVRIGLAEEGATFLDDMPAEAVVDPAALHFYRATAAFQTGDGNRTLASLDRLAELPDVPARYADTATLLRAEAAKLKADRLQGVAHDMRRTGQRLESGRTDRRVQDLGEDVIRQLDELIEELEQQQSQQESAQGQGGDPSGEPMPDSRLPGGGAAPGEVDDRAFRIATDWGKLPEKEREQALQLLDRQFPGHYREAVEQYFRRLAGAEEPGER